MTDLELAAVAAYVKSTAALLAMPMDDARAERVSIHLQRTAGMAAALAAAPLQAPDELVEIFCPAPFPSDFSV
jgi:hypothetical protein